MKRLLGMGVALAMLIIAAPTFAQTSAPPTPHGRMNCPMGDTAALKEKMSSMMSEMSDMMQQTGDPVLKERMSKLHDQMSAMMMMMQSMGGGMMNGGMMGGGMMNGGMMQPGQAAGGAKPPVPPSADDHQSHNPGQ